MIRNGSQLMMRRPYPFETGQAAIERLDAPANLTADVTGDTVTLEWDAVIDADHYEARAGGAWIVLGDVLTTDIEDLDPGNYTGRVRAVAADGIKGHTSSVAFEIEEVSTLLASIDISDPANIDSFTRGTVAGYTGDEDADAYQREATIDELRDAHEVGEELCVLLEDSPTQCGLVAPVLGTPTVDELEVSVPFTLAAGDADRLEYSWDDEDSWTEVVGASPHVVSGSLGEHTITYRRVTPGEVIGAEATTAEFELVFPVGLIATDNFDSYISATSLGDQDGWEAVGTTPIVFKPAADGSIYGSTQAMARSTATFSADHRSVLTCKLLTPGSFAFNSVGVRCQSGADTRYWFQTDGTNWYLVQRVAGDQDVLASGTHSITSGARIALNAVDVDVSDVRLTAQVDTGGGWVNVTGATDFDPTTAPDGVYIGGGSPGAGGDGGATSSALGDDWEGWDL